MKDSERAWKYDKEVNVALGGKIQGDSQGAAEDSDRELQYRICYS